MTDGVFNNTRNGVLIGLGAGAIAEYFNSGLKIVTTEASGHIVTPSFSFEIWRHTSSKASLYGKVLPRFTPLAFGVFFGFVIGMLVDAWKLTKK